MNKIFLSFAHPDDESFSCGGTVARYVKAGWQVHALCATRGEEGESGPYNVKHGEKLGEIRQKEMEKAGTILGISSITFLGFRDGTLHDESSGELEEKIFQEMIKQVPDIVITFDTTGVSNHPDHMRICYATTFAFQKYARWIRERISGLADYSEALDPKLYYACMPESVVRHLIAKKLLPPEMFGRPWKGTPDKMVTTVIDIHAQKGTKKRALLAHVTQKNDVLRFLSLDHNPLLAQEHFIFRMHGIKEVFMGKNDRIAGTL
jgi:N-acetylglucosamine malate deacetylase 2